MQQERQCRELDRMNQVSHNQNQFRETMLMLVWNFDIKEGFWFLESYSLGLTIGKIVSTYIPVSYVEPLSLQAPPRLWCTFAQALQMNQRIRGLRDAMPLTPPAKTCATVEVYAGLGWRPFPRLDVCALVRNRACLLGEE